MWFRNREAMEFLMLNPSTEIIHPASGSMTQNCRLLPTREGFFCQAHHLAQRDLGSCSSKMSRAQEERWGRAQLLTPNLPIRSPLSRRVRGDREGSRLINIPSCGYIRDTRHLNPEAVYCREVTISASATFFFVLWTHCVYPCLWSTRSGTVSWTSLTPLEIFH